MPALLAEQARRQSQRQLLLIRRIVHYTCREICNVSPAQAVPGDRPRNCINILHCNMEP
jgi:hypothetical protein